MIAPGYERLDSGEGTPGRKDSDPRNNLYKIGDETIETRFVGYAHDDVADFDAICYSFDDIHAFSRL
jgi:hypothetical protein